MHIARLISYYKDCYQADTRTLTLTNFFSKKVENRWMVEGKEELLNGNLPYLPINDQLADDIEKNLSIYKKEKELYYCTFFVIGSGRGLERSDKICAPLFLFPASIVEADEYKFLRIDRKKRILNINFLNTIKQEGAKDLFTLFNKKVSRSQFGFGECGMIKKILEKNIESCDASEILFYPELYSEAKIKRLLQPKNLNAQGKYLLLPAAGIGVIRKSNSTMGIITELDEIANTGDYAAPLHYLLAGTSSADAIALKKGYIPSTLNTAQETIIKEVNQNLCTLVIGPPGTGKSYTIASLAVEFMSKGKSVLIASKTNQAVDVVGDKIEKDLGIQGVVTRAGKSNYLRELKSYLENILSAIRKPSQADNINEIEKKLADVNSQIRTFEKRFKNQVVNELKWGKYLAENHESRSFIAQLRKEYIKWRNSLQQPHWELTKNLLNNLDKKVNLIKIHVKLDYEQQVETALIFERKTLKTFLKGIRARTSSRQEELFKSINFSVILKTFPIWLTNLSDIHDVLPLKKELFDLAIIDEATQCDIASCLPIIQRAKRVAIVGDPKQLRHVSFLSDAVQRTLQKKHQISSSKVDATLDYRGRSFLDLVTEKIEYQNQVVFLDEHYRSALPIIQFSNQYFYNDALKIMTSAPTDNTPDHIVHLAVNGFRNKAGINKEEAHAILDRVGEIIQQQSSFDGVLCQSIGILSPFRDQADYIADELSKKIDLQYIQKHKISCGTAYAFQGEERDIMFISFGIDNDTHPAALQHLNKPDVLNVAITRARALQFIYTSFDPKKLSKESLLSTYLSFIKEEYKLERHIPDVKDQFLSEVREKLHCLNYETWPAFEVAGMEVDLVFKREKRFYGINLIGFPGDYENAFSIEEYKILNRAGLKTFPLPYTYWKFDCSNCMKELELFSQD